MPFLLQEGHVLSARRACSRVKKGLFLSHLCALSEWIEEQLAKYPNIFCLSIGCSLFYYLSFNRVNLCNLFCERNTSPPPQPSFRLDRESIPQQFTLRSVLIKKIVNDSRNALCSLSAGGLLWLRGPSPVPSPEGKGRDHRDTPIRRMQAYCCSLFVSTQAVTLCVLCRPEAFCGFET